MRPRFYFKDMCYIMDWQIQTTILDGYDTIKA